MLTAKGSSCLARRAEDGALHAPKNIDSVNNAARRITQLSIMLESIADFTSFARAQTPPLATLRTILSTVDNSIAKSLCTKVNQHPLTQASGDVD